MPTLANTVIHTEVTVRSGDRYQSTPKHHGADPGAAQWLESMSLAPLGQTGLMKVKAGREIEQAITVNQVPGRPLDFYKVAALHS